MIRVPLTKSDTGFTERPCGAYPVSKQDDADAYWQKTGRPACRTARAAGPVSRESGTHAYYWSDERWASGAPPSRRWGP